MSESPLMEIIRKRRSVRKFLPAAVEKWKIREMVEAARLAPSACNVQPWRFIAITDEKLRAEICARALGGIVPNSFARTAPLLVIICAEKQFLTNKAGEFLKDISYHQIDTGIAGEHLVLRATELGLGTCWVGWFDEKAVRKILYIPRHIKVLSLIAAGYYDEQAQPEKAGKRRLEEILFWDAYGQRGE